MKTCPKCGCEVVDNAKFCKNCGSEINYDEFNNKNSQNTCPNCGHEVDEGMKFCKNCGYKIIQEHKENKSNFCKNCGTKLSSNEKFCPNCGISSSEEQGKQNKFVQHNQFDNIINGEKSPILAVLLSFFLPGIGQIYLGLVKKGIILFIITMVGSGLLSSQGIGYIIWFIVWAYALYDAYNSGDKIRKGIKVEDKLDFHNLF